MEPSQESVIAGLRARVRELEEENARLVEQLAHARAQYLPPLHRAHTFTAFTGAASTMSGPSARSPAGSPPDRGVPSAHGEGPTLDAASREEKAAASVGSAAPAPGVALGEPVCDNCGASVPAATLAMHRAYCMRHMRRCAFCGEVLKATEHDAHVATLRGTLDDAHAAAARGDTDALTAMLVHGADKASQRASTDGDALIHTATRFRRTGVIELLLSRGVSVNACNAHGETSLHVAVALRDDEDGGAEGRVTALDMATWLVQHGSDVAARTAVGDTPLHVAQRRTPSDPAMLLLLSAAGAPIRPSSRDGRQRPASASSLSRLRPPSASSARGDSKLSDGDFPLSPTFVGTPAPFPRRPSEPFEPLPRRPSASAILGDAGQPREPSSGISSRRPSFSIPTEPVRVVRMPL